MYIGNANWLYDVCIITFPWQGDGKTLNIYVQHRYMYIYAHIHVYGKCQMAFRRMHFHLSRTGTRIPSSVS